MTVTELKAKYKTLAAAKTGTGIKARSWAALAEKLSEPTIESLQAEIASLKAEIASLKQGDETEYQSDYFKSAEAELIYSIVKLDGPERSSALQIGRKHYSDAKKAKNWRNEIANRVHPDKCKHPDAQKAISKITELYQGMVA